MQKINSFLDKFKKLIRYDKEIKETIIEVIERFIGATIEKQDIKIKNKIIYLKSHPLIKSEILIKKDLILKELNQRLKISLEDLL